MRHRVWPAHRQVSQSGAWKTSRVPRNTSRPSRTPRVYGTHRRRSAIFSHDMAYPPQSKATGEVIAASESASASRSTGGTALLARLRAESLPLPIERPPSAARKKRLPEGVLDQVVMPEGNIWSGQGLFGTRGANRAANPSSLTRGATGRRRKFGAKSLSLQSRRRGGPVLAERRPVGAVPGSAMPTMAIAVGVSPT